MTIETHSPRWLTLDGAVNARIVVPGVLLRSDNLQGLSQRDIRQLVDEQHLEAVLDLRTEVELASEGPGPMNREPAVRIEHHSLYPQMGNTDLDLDGETVNPWGSAHSDGSHPDELPVVGAYMRYLNRRPDSVVSSMQTIARSGGAVLAHCAAGKDRTGVIVAMALDAAGVERDVIVADYLATAERITQIMDRLISSPTYRAELEGHDPQRHAPQPGTMERVLELVDTQSGGSAEWLRANGLSSEDLALLYRRINGSTRDDTSGAGTAPRGTQPA